MQMPNNRKDRYHRPNARSFAKIQKEAIIMERLTASPRIVSAYGHCGLSILSEPMSEEVSPLIIPNTGYAKQSELDKLPDVQPANNLTAFEKLDMALDMAKSIADIHGHPGLIVHGDIHPVQWLFSNRRQLKLNDFNNADILQWSRSENDYCKVDRGSWGGMYRSPEEFEGELADEKIDVYSMGNTIYVLLTGYWPFYEDKSYSVVQGKVMNATRPFVDDRYRHRSFIEGQMVEIMERMWEHDPADRPSIFEVIAFLTNVRAKVFRNGERKNTADPEDFVTVQQELVWDHSF
jgi:serine/threonine protein kinase